MQLTIGGFHALADCKSLKVSCLKLHIHTVWIYSSKCDVIHMSYVGRNCHWRGCCCIRKRIKGLSYSSTFLRSQVVRVSYPWMYLATASHRKKQTCLLHFYKPTGELLPLGNMQLHFRQMTSQYLDIRVLSKLDISNNNLTQGELVDNSDSDADSDQEAEYETDLSGVIALADVLEK